MHRHRKPSAVACPVTSATVRADAQGAAFNDLVQFCQTSAWPFARFETRLIVLMAVLGQGLIRLFLTARRERSDLQPFLAQSRYRFGDEQAERTLKTVHGEVTDRRAYLL